MKDHIKITSPLGSTARIEAEFAKAGATPSLYRTLGNHYTDINTLPASIESSDVCHFAQFEIFTDNRKGGKS